jgi:transposase
MRDGMFVGIDVSKDEVVIAVVPSGKTWTARTTAAGLTGLVTKLRALTPTLVVLEATGGYEIPVLAALCDAEIPVSLVQPARVREYAKSQGILAKTDRLDAQVLARFAAQLDGALRVYPDEAQRALMVLVQRYRQLTELLAAERQRLDQQALLRRSPIVAELEETVAYLASKLRDTERQLHAHVAAHPRWDAAHQLLRSIPGIGFLTAVTLLAYLPELGRLDRRALAALAGIAPMARDSGRHRGVRQITGGRAIVRHLLYMAALSHTRATAANAVFATHYQQLRARGKPAKVALIAGARRLLTIANAVLRTQTPWQPHLAAPTA